MKHETKEELAKNWLDWFMRRHHLYTHKDTCRIYADQMIQGIIKDIEKGNYKKDINEIEK
jgi:hypothetical protein